MTPRHLEPVDLAPEFLTELRRLVAAIRSTPAPMLELMTVQGDPSRHNVGRLVKALRFAAKAEPTHEAQIEAVIAKLKEAADA